MLVDVLVGVLVGYAVLVAVAAAALPRRGRAAPHDRAAAGAVRTVPTPVVVGPHPPRGDRDRGAPDGIPTGAVQPIDVWDVLVVVLLLGMVLAVPVVGGVVAALLVPLLVVAPLLALRYLGDHLGGGPPRRPG